MIMGHSQMIKQTRKQYSFLVCVACSCARGDQRVTSGVFLAHSPPHVCDSFFLNLQLTVWLCWKTNDFQVPLYVSGVDLKSSPHSCAASTLPTKPPPQPKSFSKRKWDSGSFAVLLKPICPYKSTETFQTGKKLMKHKRTRV